LCGVQTYSGPVAAGEDLAEYVLHPMDDRELEQAAEMVDAAVEAVEWILQKGAKAAMNRFNRRAGGPESETDSGTTGSGMN
jgi:peptidyl-tRNA hydrolase